MELPIHPLIVRVWPGRSVSDSGRQVLIIWWEQCLPPAADLMDKDANNKQRPKLTILLNDFYYKNEQIFWAISGVGWWSYPLCLNLVWSGMQTVFYSQAWVNRIVSDQHKLDTVLLCLPSQFWVGQILLGMVRFLSGSTMKSSLFSCAATLHVIMFFCFLFFVCHTRPNTNPQVHRQTHKSTYNLTRQYWIWCG